MRNWVFDWDLQGVKMLASKPHKHSVNYAAKPIHIPYVSITGNFG
jgi:hypothetical protein